MKSCPPIPADSERACTPSAPPAFVPIHSLLLLCARPQLDGAEIEELRALAAHGMDWTGVLNIATEHAVAPLVCRRLDDLASDILPRFWRDKFRDIYKCNIHRNLLLTSELFRVLSALEMRGIRATPFKGPALAAQAYGDIALRQFADLDIIVPHREIALAHHVLQDLNYHSDLTGEDIQKSLDSERFAHGQFAYRKEAGNTHVELHSEMTLRYFPRQLDLESLIGRIETIKFAGGSALTFSFEDLFILLSVHGSKHFWDRLGWIADIAALAKSSNGIGWELMIERARCLGAERMVFLAAELARTLLNAQLPAEINVHIDRDPAIHRLVESIRSRFSAFDQTQPGVFSRFKYRIRMCTQKGEGIRYAVRLAMKPTEVDRNSNFFANHFEFACAVLRPLRLARQYGWRTRMPAASGPSKLR
jgi:hypothetical protein